MTSPTPRRHQLFTDEDELLRDSIRRWVAREIVPNIDAWERAREFPRELFPQFGQQGSLGLQVPVEFGGQGGDFVTNMILCEELSRAGAESVSSAISVHT